MNLSKNDIKKFIYLIMLFFKMNEKNITKIIKEFKSFKEEFINDIKNKPNPKLINYK